MFGLGVPELVLILGIIIIIFGAGKLPEIGSALGKSIREFRSATDEVTSKDTPAQGL
jgi:sec-independent protein translocase protein TatA